jgi:hypothetical protein
VAVIPNECEGSRLDTPKYFTTEITEKIISQTLCVLGGENNRPDGRIPYAAKPDGQPHLRQPR